LHCTVPILEDSVTQNSRQQKQIKVIVDKSTTQSNKSVTGRRG